MEAIEIYQKILEVVKDQEFNDVNLAINFVRQKIENEYYSAQKNSQLSLASGSMLGAGNACTPYDPEARAAAIVRQVVREELDKTPDQTEAKEAA